MKIGIVTHAYPRYDGDVAGAFIERLAEALHSRGHQIHVVAPSDEGRGGDEVRHGVPVTRVRYAPARREILAYRGTMATAGTTPTGLLDGASLLWRQARVLARLCKAERLDLVHAQWWVPGGVSTWLARRPPPFIVTLHGMDVVLLEQSRLARLAAARVLRAAAAVTAVSSDLARRAALVLHFDPERIVVQPMPIDPGWLAGSGAGGGGGGVVTVGRLTARKRLPLLFEALALLRAEGRALPLTVVGDGAERAALERRVAELGLGSQVRFLGQLPPARVRAAIEQADVFAFPALGEGLGLAAVEALLCGIPVVAMRDGGGVCDIVPEGGAGRLVEPTAEAIARAIGELISDPAARRLAAEAGAALHHRLEPGAVADRFERVYREALMEPGRRSDRA